MNCSGDNSRPRWRLGLLGCKYDDEGNGAELKSPDEKLARETISESEVGEPENPLSVLFHAVYAESEGKEYFRDYCVPRFRTVRKDSERTMGMQKASMQTAGAKQCYAFVMVRIKRIDIAVAEETSARRNIGSGKMFPPSLTVGAERMER